MNKPGTLFVVATPMASSPYQGEVRWGIDVAAILKILNKQSI